MQTIPARGKSTNCILELHKKISNFTQRYTINFYLDKKYSRPAKENLDRLVKKCIHRLMKFLTGQKIFDPQEQISKVRYQASKVGFAYRLMEWHPKSWILKLISTTFVHNGFPNNSISSHNSKLYRWNGWKLCQFDLHFTPIWKPRRSIADVPGTHWIRSAGRLTLIVTCTELATTSRLGRRHMGTGLSIFIFSELKGVTPPNPRRRDITLQTHRVALLNGNIWLKTKDLYLLKEKQS